MNTRTAKITTWTGLGIFIAATVWGFIPTHEDGRNCASVLAPGRKTSELCQAARDDMFPYVAIPLAIGLIVFLTGIALWVLVERREERKYRRAAQWHASK